MKFCQIPRFEKSLTVKEQLRILENRIKERGRYVPAWMFDKKKELEAMLCK